MALSFLKYLGRLLLKTVTEGYGSSLMRFSADRVFGMKLGGATCNQPRLVG